MARKWQTREQLKREVELRVNRVVPSLVWDDVEEWVEIAMGDQDKASFDYLLDRVRKAFKLVDAKPDELDSSEEEAPVMLERRASPQQRFLRQQVVSKMIAADADSDAFVQSFRERVLGNQLLDWAEVESWIKTRLEGATGGHRITVDLPDDVTIDPEFRLSRPFEIGPDLKRERFGLRTETLDYAVPGNAWVLRVPIPRDQVLRELHDLSQALSNHYRWDEAAATVFVLTGRIPYLTSIKVTTSRSSYPATSRVILTVDPEVSPNEVAAAYRSARKEFRSRKVRSLTEKHLSLAAFMADRPDDESAVEALSAWNAEHPEWAYTKDRIRSFRRDVNAAQRRVLRVE